MKKQNIGFDGRMFLHDYEWKTYMRRMPVRYIRNKRHAEVCDVCGLPGTEENPLEHSHRIGFLVGVRDFGLTPDYLDSHSNIVSAHKRVCNASAELSRGDVAAYLQSIGASIPKYLE